MNARSSRGRDAARSRIGRPGRAGSPVDRDTVVRADPAPGASWPEGRSRRSRGYGMQWKMIVILTAVWVLLMGDISVGIVVAGFVLGVLVTWVFPLPPVVYRGRLRPAGVLRIAGRLGYDLVSSSIAVALVAFRRETPRSAVIRVPLRGDSDLYEALTTELVSLVPGTLVVEARRSTRTLYIHVLGVCDDADLERARREAQAAEERVIRAYGSADEIAALDRAIVAEAPAASDPASQASPSGPVGSAAAGSAAVGSAAVGSGAVGSAAVGSGAVGSAAAGSAAVVPDPSGADRPEGDGA